MESSGDVFILDSGLSMDASRETRDASDEADDAAQAEDAQTQNDACQPHCVGIACGDDGCGGRCGRCTEQQHACVAGACVCQPDCVGKICGDDGCGGSCGRCTETQHACVAGACVCQPDCAAKTCGNDGCGGVCGRCNLAQQYCNSRQRCVSCETAQCGVCDEIDVSTIVGYSGSLGIDHGNRPLSAAVFNWPITSELEVAFPPGALSAFTIDHFPGESWSIYTGGSMEGAGMVACWDKVGVGIYCLGWDWWTMASRGYKSFDWPANRPVAHMLFSAADQKRTAIKYFNSWPHNNPPGGYTGSTVGTGLTKRTCQ